MSKRIVVVAAGLISASALALPSVAAPKDKDAGSYVPPAEAGCYDLRAAPAEGEPMSSLFKRIIEQVHQSPVIGAANLYGPTTVTYQPRGVFDGTMALAAPSCPEAVYVVTITAVDTGAVLGRHARSGDGSSPNVKFEEVAGTDKDCVHAVFSIEDSRGNVIDLSPDAGVAPVRPCDGGGAGSYTN